MEFFLPLDKMPWGFRSRFFFNAYEKEERSLCLKYIQPQDQILELGACIGVVSCICNRILKDSSKHVAVEANPELTSWIERNRQHNRASFLIEQGMLSKTSNGDFRIERFIVSGSANTTTGTLVKVPVISIEEICNKHQLVPTIIVMDIEGGEISFLKENRIWLTQNCEMKTIILEMHPAIVGIKVVGHLRGDLESLGFILQETLGSVECWQR